MAGPWEKYQNQPEAAAPPVAAAQEAGPWQNYENIPSAWEEDGQAPLEIEVPSNARNANPANNSAFARMISGEPAPQPEGNAVGRFLGQIGGREVLQGAYGLYGALGGDALDYAVLGPIDRQLGTNLGTGGRGYRQAASELADSLGMYKPQTAEDRIRSNIGEALTGTGLTLGIGAGLNALAQTGRAGASASKVGNFLTAQPLLQTVSAATGSGASGAVREAGGSEGQQLAAGLLAGLGPGVASAATQASLRGAVRGTSGQQMRNTIADFEALGATPSVAQASGNRVLQGAENLLAGGPTSAGVMGRFVERQADDIGAGLSQQGETLARNASGERAGRAIERGVDTFSRNIGATKKALYWQADRYIPSSTPVQLNNTMQATQRLTTPMAGAAETTGSLINPRIAELRKNLQADLDAGNGQIPYEALKRIRTDIGEQISDFSLSPDTPTRELKQIYAALSRDMEAAAQSQGPMAVAAAKRANNYTRAAAERVEQIQRVIDKNGGPEAVFNAAMQGSKDGGTTLRSVMQSLPKEGQQAVTAAVVKRMGMATPGAQTADGDAFSAATFLSNWNKFSPEARRALFDRHGLGFSAAMDRVARVADNIKTGAKVYANPSGTANRAAAMTYGGALVASLFDPTFASTGGLLLSGATANGMARVLTSPRAVRWLAQATQMPRGAFVSSLRQMSEAANRTGAEDMMELSALLEEAENNQDAANNQQKGQAN